MLELAGDYYSLNLFSFYLDTDDEDLSEMKNCDDIKEKISKQGNNLLKESTLELN